MTSETSTEVPTDDQAAESDVAVEAEATTASDEEKAKKAEERAQKKEAAKAEARAKEIEEGEKLLTEITEGGPFDVVTAVRALTRRLVGDGGQVSLSSSSSTPKATTWSGTSTTVAPEATDPKGKKAN